MGKGREPHPRKAKSARPMEKGRLGDAAKFREQLSLLSLRIVEVTPDGNCFFRAISEQLEGNEHSHHNFREQVVDYLELHRTEFEPFVEDDVPFDDYCKTMREDGTWAGNMELQAVSLMTSSNICIHRLMFPRWHIRNFEDPDYRTLHLSYHDGEHYNSLRSNDDDGKGPAKPILIEADATPGARVPARDRVTGVENGKSSFDATAVKIVVASTQCSDAAHVQEVLQDVEGDMQAAIEFLLSEQACNEDTAPSMPETSELDSDPADDAPSLRTPSECSPDESNLESAVSCDKDTLQVDFREDPVLESAEAESSKTMEPDSPKQESGFQYRTQGVARNKPCPCGSKKKYKACCGAIRSRAVPTGPEISYSDLTNKVRKDRLRSAKVVAQPTGARRRSNLGSTGYSVVDMGSLCI